MDISGLHIPIISNDIDLSALGQPTIQIYIVQDDIGQGQKLCIKLEYLIKKTEPQEHHPDADASVGQGQENVTDDAVRSTTNCQSEEEKIQSKTETRCSDVSIPGFQNGCNQNHMISGLNPRNGFSLRRQGVGKKGWLGNHVNQERIMKRDVVKNELEEILKEIQRDETTITWHDKSKDLNEEADNHFLDDTWAQLFFQEEAAENMTREASKSTQKEKIKDVEGEGEGEENSLIEDVFIGGCKEEAKTVESPKKQQCSREEAAEKERRRNGEDGQNQTNAINRNGLEKEKNNTEAKHEEPILTGSMGERFRKKRTFRAPTTRSKNKSGVSDALLADLKELEKVMFGGRPGPRPKLEENNCNDERNQRPTVGGTTKLFVRKMINLCGGCEAGPTPVYYNSYM